MEPSFRYTPSHCTDVLMLGLYAAYERAVVERVIGANPEHARCVAALVVRNPDRLWDDLVLRWQQRWNSV